MNKDTDMDAGSDTGKKNIHPFSTYLLIWFGLLVLTGVTITVAGMNLGNLSVLGAIVIAAVKSSLVVLFFMNINVPVDAKHVAKQSPDYDDHNTQMSQVKSDSAFGE